MGEYEEFLSKIPAAKRVPEPFTGIDNKLDFLGPKILDMQGRVTRIESALSQLDLPVTREQIPFFYNLPSGKRVTMTEYAPFAGYIKEVKITWPEGCDSLVDVRVGHGRGQIVPYPIEEEGWLALNDTTETYRPNEPVAANEHIWVEMGNGDEKNAHKITVTVTLEGTA